MLSVSRINEQYRQQFGIMMRIHRLKQRLTLRNLAKRTGLSHTLLNRIELGNATVTEDNYGKITDALGVVFLHDPSKNQVFDRMCDRIHAAIFYAETAKVDTWFSLMEETEDYYLRSLCVLDYLLAKIGAYIHIHERRAERVDEAIEWLSQIVGLMDEDEALLFSLYRGMHGYLKNDFQQCETAMQTIMEATRDFRYASLADYFLGRAQSETYRINEANASFTQAMQGFEETTNTRRAVYTRMYIAVNRMKLYEYKKADQAFIDVARFAESNDMMWLKETALIYLTIHAMLTGDYQRAIEVAEGVKYRTLQWYAITGYAYLRLDDKRRLAKTLKDISKAAPMFDRNRLYESAINYLRIHDNKTVHDPDKEEAAIRQFYQAAKASNAFFELELAFELYREHLVSRRRYKDAYGLTREMIDIVQTTMQ